MPPLPLTCPAKMPARLLPMAMDRNQQPMAMPPRRTGASLVVMERPMGDRHNSPTDWITYTANSVQNGILPASLTMLDSATISSRKARPLKIRPRPNLRGIEGLFLPSFTHIHAMTGARVMIAIELTDWNHSSGKVQSPNWRLTIWSARKVNELPACSKKIQNITLNTKITSIASTLSRATLPSRTPSTTSMPAGITNSAIRIACSALALMVSRK